LVTLTIFHKNIFQLHKIAYIPIVVQLQNTNYFCEGKKYNYYKIHDMYLKQWHRLLWGIGSRAPSNFGNLYYSSVESH